MKSFILVQFHHSRALLHKLEHCIPCAYFVKAKQADSLRYSRTPVCVLTHGNWLIWNIFITENVRGIFSRPLACVAYMNRCSTKEVLFLPRCYYYFFLWPTDRHQDVTYYCSAVARQELWWLNLVSVGGWSCRKGYDPLGGRVWSVSFFLFFLKNLSRRRP